MRHSHKPIHRVEIAALALVAALAMSVATGCGKPQYCEDLSTLQGAVKDLPSQATSKGVSGLEAQLKTIQSDADALVSSAKSDFPNETTAVESSVNQLKSSVTGLPAEPTTAELAAIALNASAVVNSVQQFQAATKDACK
jgi:hypothetical protein